MADRSRVIPVPPWPTQYSALGSTPITGDEQEILRFHATVAADAAPPKRGTTGNGLYGSSTLINTSISSDQITGEPIAIDPGLIVMAYVGDTTGNGTLSSLDASRVQRVVVGLDSGFDAYDKFNPVLLGDTTGNGGLSSLDTFTHSATGGWSAGQLLPRYPTAVVHSMVISAVINWFLTGNHECYRKVFLKIGDRG